MPLLSPSLTVLGVFVATTWSLAISVSRDLASAPQLEEWRRRLADVASHPFHGTPADHEAISKDMHLALSVIQRSELTVYLMVQWCISAYGVVVLLTVAIFLGQLSSREVSRLSERLLKFIVFKVVFCGALIIPDIYEIVLWLAWFAMVGYMRIFMGAAKDRLESLVVSPRATTLSHMRTLALVLVILAHDVAGMAALLSSVGSMSLTKVLLCAFDMAIVLVEGVKTLLRYAVHIWDQHVASQDAPADTQQPHSAGTSSTFGWESWEGKGALLYHAELVADVLVHAMTLAHYLHVWFLHGLSFQLIDAILFLDIRSIILSMLKRIRGYLNYRHATHSLRHAFPDAMLGSSHELCSICMERMSCAKQLPCQHHFHLACLRAWLQQSGTESFACPLCRTPLLRERAAEAAAAQHARRQAAQLRAAQQHAPGSGQPRGLLRRGLSGISRVVSALYLDLLIGLLLGLPSSTAALQRHAMAAAAANRDREMGGSMGVGGGSGLRSGRRGGGRHAPEDTAVERVGENDHPSPVAAERARTAGASRPLLRAWLGALVPGVLRRRMAAAGGRGTAADDTGPVEEEDDQVYSTDTDGEPFSTDEEDMRDIAAEDDSFQAPSQLLRRSYGHWGSVSHHQRYQQHHPFPRPHHQQQQQQQRGRYSPALGQDALPPSPVHLGHAAAEAIAGHAGPASTAQGQGEVLGRGLEGHDGGDRDMEGAEGGEGDMLGQLPPMLPPPYPEPSTWSAGSLQAVGRQVAHTIRTSWGMGMHGPGAVAGHEHTTDQEAQSGLRIRQRQRSRPSLAASPAPPPMAPLDDSPGPQWGEGAEVVGRQLRRGRRGRRGSQAGGAGAEGGAGAGDGEDVLALPQRRSVSGASPRSSG